MAATEKFANGVGENNVGILESATDGFEITPDDANDIIYITRAIYVGRDGDIKLTLKSGATLTFSNAVAGSIIPVRATRVYATGTTATNLLGLL